MAYFGGFPSEQGMFFRHLYLAVWAYWGAVELRLINMDERIAVGTRYFVVDPAGWAAPWPRIPTGYYPPIS